MNLSGAASARNKNKLGRSRQAYMPTFLWCNGQPTGNDPLYAPDRAGQIIIDLLNKDVYLVTLYISASNFTIVKMSD